jgi:hypothetical protein
MDAERLAAAHRHVLPQAFLDAIEAAKTALAAWEAETVKGKRYAVNPPAAEVNKKTEPEP